MTGVQTCALPIFHVRFIARDELPAFAEYFGDGWGKARLAGGRRYEISIEDEFIFSFLHFFKHFIFSGIGLKHIVDLWIFMEKSPNLDLAYVENELNGLKMLEFYKNVTNSIKVLFSDQKGDEKTDFIVNHVLECGTWGTEKTAAISRGVATKRKVGRSGGVRGYTILKLLFPPRKDLQVHYPVLRKHFYLLPFVWIVRWVNVAVHKRDTVAFRRREIKEISTENVNELEAKFTLVGINLLK